MPTKYTGKKIERGLKKYSEQGGFPKTSVWDRLRALNFKLLREIYR
jgi:hypothetical protein